MRYQSRQQSSKKAAFKGKKQVYNRKDEEQYADNLFETKKKTETPATVVPKSIDIMESISVSDLAKKMNLKASEVIAKLMGMGMMITITQPIDSDTATLLAAEYGCEVHLVSLYDETVIESDKDISSELPFEKANLPVVFTDNVKPYKDRKVRVLNGAHTASVLISYLGGINVVRDMMSDEVFGKMIKTIVDNEIVPMVPLAMEDVKAFADSVYERFDNPFINHELLSISLNSVSKWRERVLPSFKDNYNKNRKVPTLLTFSFAGLLAFYRSSDLRDDGLHAKRNDGTEYIVHDNKEVLSYFSNNCKMNNFDYVKAIASNENFWGEDLSEYLGFCRKAALYLEKIEEDPRQATKYVLG